MEWDFNPQINTKYPHCAACP